VASAVRSGADALASSLERHVAPTGEALDAFAAAVQALHGYAAETGFEGATSCALPVACCIRCRPVLLVGMHVDRRTLELSKGLGIMGHLRI
jgi:hypothetical protein